MIAPSHITFSQTFYLASCIFWSSPATPMGAFIAALACFIPDFDTRASLPGRLLPHVSEWIHAQFGHRSITHAFLPQLSLWIIFYFLVYYHNLSIDIAIAIAAGWFSHSAADMLTKTGVFFWWPSRRYRCVAWKNPRFRVEVMSLGEWWWSMAMFILAIPLFMAAQTETGASGIIKHALGDIQLAVQEYQRYKGKNAWYLDIEGTSNNDLKRIDGRYYVVDVKSESAFYIQDTQGQTVTVSNATTSDWFVSSAILEKGEPELTHTINLKKNEIERDKLITALETVTKSNKCFITGKLATENKAGDIEAKKLEYVSISNLPDAVRYHALDLKIQIKHSPNIELRQLEIKSDPPKVRQDKILDKWLDEALKKNEFTQ